MFMAGCESCAVTNRVVVECASYSGSLRAVVADSLVSVGLCPISAAKCRGMWPRRIPSTPVLVSRLPLIMTPPPSTFVPFQRNADALATQTYQTIHYCEYTELRSTKAYIIINLSIFLDNQLLYHGMFKVCFCAPPTLT